MSKKLSVLGLWLALCASACHASTLVECGVPLSDSSLNEYLVVKYPLNRGELLAATKEELKKCPDDVFLRSLEFYSEIGSGYDNLSILAKRLEKLGVLREDQMVEVGFSALKSGEFAAASNYLGRAFHGGNKSIGLTLGYARALVELGRLQEANKALEVALSKKKESFRDDAERAQYADSLLLSSEILFSLGNYKESLVRAKRTISFDHDHSGGYEVLLASVVRVKNASLGDINAGRCAAAYLHDEKRSEDDAVVSDSDTVSELYKKSSAGHTDARPISYPKCIESLTKETE